jgi:hypothetical protein
MRRIFQEMNWRGLPVDGKTMGWGSYAVIAILLGMLVCAIVIAERGWPSTAVTSVPPGGYISLIIGVAIDFLFDVGAALIC